MHIYKIMRISNETPSDEEWPELGSTPAVARKNFPMPRQFRRERRKLVEETSSDAATPSSINTKTPESGDRKHFCHISPMYRNRGQFWPTAAPPKFRPNSSVVMESSNRDSRLIEAENRHHVCSLASPTYGGCEIPLLLDKSLGMLTNFPFVLINT